MRMLALNDDHTVREVEPAEWMELTLARIQECEEHDTDPWRVGRDMTEVYFVSTVFLGAGDNPFETYAAVKDGDDIDVELTRYATWDEAVAGHAAEVARLSDPRPPELKDLVDFLAENMEPLTPEEEAVVQAFIDKQEAKP